MATSIYFSPVALAFKILSGTKNKEIALNTLKQHLLYMTFSGTIDISRYLRQPPIQRTIIPKISITSTAGLLVGNFVVSFFYLLCVPLFTTGTDQPFDYGVYGSVELLWQKANGNHKHFLSSRQSSISPRTQSSASSFYTPPESAESGQIRFSSNSSKRHFQD